MIKRGGKSPRQKPLEKNAVVFQEKNIEEEKKEEENIKKTEDDSDSKAAELQMLIHNQIMQFIEDQAKNEEKPEISMDERSGVIDMENDFDPPEREENILIQNFERFAKKENEEKNDKKLKENSDSYESQILSKENSKVLQLDALLRLELKDSNEVSYEFDPIDAYQPEDDQDIDAVDMIKQNSNEPSYYKYKKEEIPFEVFEEPVFKPAMLREQRFKIGMPLKRLSTITRIHVKRLREIEDGKEPTQDEIEVLAQAMKENS